MGDSHESRRSDGRPGLEISLSPEEREAIIQDIISTQMLAGIDVSYEMVAEAVDEVLRSPMPVLEKGS